MSHTPIRFELSTAPLSLSEFEAGGDARFRVEIAPTAAARVREARDIVETTVRSGRSVYGVNTGFGKLCNVRIPAEQLNQLQVNLVRSHAVGVGPPAPAGLVRVMLLLKIHSLLAGASGVSPAVIDGLAAMLNADVLPVVPTRGSLGASGDLAPLAHLSLPLIGEGEVSMPASAAGMRDATRRVLPAAEALRAAGIAPVALGPKDGLALLNGTQFMAAYAVEAVVRARRLAAHADIIATMTLEAIRGSIKPFSAGLLRLRPHPGALEVGANVTRMMADSEILASHANCDKVQDPYSIRCVPQVHGACRDALRHVAEVVTREINAVTDNPVLVGDEIVSGGNFHGEPLALTLDYLCMALTEWANISERRTYLMLGGPDGLPTLLMKDTGINSGFMIPQYTAAALVNECKVLSTPASVDSIPSSLGQEDHVSMGATSAVKCLQVVENAETVLAIEMLCAAQALDYRAPLKPGVGPRAALAAVRKRISHAEADREFGKDIRAAVELLRGGDVVRAVSSAAEGRHSVQHQL